MPDATATAVKRWGALDEAWDRAGGDHGQASGRLLAYCAAARANGPAELLENWRWRMPLWTPADRDAFRAVMTQAWQERVRIQQQLDELKHDNAVRVAPR